jgi:gliding motility-associated lipoprotein GldD
MFPKIEYPRGDYYTFNSDRCPFTFELPSYTEIDRNSKYIQMNPPDDCWFNIKYPMFQAQLYCSYAPLSGKASYDNYKSDAFEIVDQINRRSDYMEEYRYENQYGVSGVVFDFSGPAASPMQFFLSDSSDHFFKAALYYDTQNDPDSLGPISEFIKRDMGRILETFQWTQPESGSKE